MFNPYFLVDFYIINYIYLLNHRITYPLSKDNPDNRKN